MTERVRVFIEMDGREIDAFTGTLEPGCPWAFWHRVRPDAGHFDLPPIFRVQKIAEAS